MEIEHFSILIDLLVVFGVAGLVVYVFHRLLVPAVVGLLVSGLVVGPYGLRLVHDVEQVQVLAEVGVVVLLFAVGVEYSLSRLFAMWRVMLLVGVPQVLTCVVVTTLATEWYFGAWGPAIFAGMLVAMSSTAVVLKVLTDRGELGAPHGRLAIAVLLLQDLLVMVFMLVVPLLAPDGRASGEMWLSIVLGLLVVAGVLVASRYMIPPLLHQVVRTRNRELFLILIFLLGIGTAALTAWVGLSLALGAFLAGLAVSESEYAHQALSEVMPFRDTLSSLFFVSVGMLLDVRFLVGHLPLVAVTVLAVMALKFVAGAVPSYLLGYPLRIAALTGAALFQVGEFSFVLAGRGLEVGLLESEDYQTFLAAAVITMVLTPFLLAGSPRLADRLATIPGLGERVPGRLRTEPVETRAELRDHVIIVGYGLSGRNLARVLLSVEIPYVILEMNPEVVRRSRGEGEPIRYGDATRASVLEHLGIAHARLLVIAISDPAATRRAVQIARQLNPMLHIIVRTRYLIEIDELERLGANEIIPEEFVASVEIFARVLHQYHVPRNQILDLVDRIRSDQYEALRDVRPAVARLNLLQREVVAQAEIESCLIREGSPAVGRTVGELRLRAATGATVLSVRRGRQWLTNPDARFQFQAGDVAILFGDREQVDLALAMLDPTIA